MQKPSKKTILMVTYIFTNVISDTTHHVGLYFFNLKIGQIIEEFH